MRAVIYGGANSLDNFLARPDGGVDWLRWTAGSAKIMRDLWQRIDTMLMGRKTYEVSKRMSPPRAAAKAGAKQPQRKTPDGETIPSVRTFIFSRTLPDEPGVEIVREDVVDFVRRLKAEPGKDILIMGGGELARPLFEAGLVDRVGFAIQPVLLGAGVPAFHPMTRQIDLELISCAPLGEGCVYVDYRVVHQPLASETSTRDRPR
jgi:dihydrofolate reductase